MQKSYIHNLVKGPVHGEHGSPQGGHGPVPAPVPSPVPDPSEDGSGLATPRAGITALLLLEAAQGQTEAQEARNSVSGQSVSAHSVSRQSVSGQSVSGQSVSAESACRQSVSGQSISGESASTQASAAPAPQSVSDASNGAQSGTDASSSTTGSSVAPPMAYVPDYGRPLDQCGRVSDPWPFLCSHAVAI